MEGKLLNLREAAEYLAIKETSVYWLHRTKQISHYRVNGKLRFSTTDLDKYLESVRVEAVPT